MKKQYDRESAVRLLVNMRAPCLPVAKTVTHSARFFACAVGGHQCVFRPLARVHWKPLG